jgi:xanthine dehydrogenase accessory factor
MNIFEVAADLRAKGEPFVLATVVAYRRPQSAKPGSKAIIRHDGTITGWVGGGCVQPIVLREAKKVLELGKPNLIIISPDSTQQGWEGVQEYLMSCQGGGSLEIYLEPVLPRRVLIVLGKSPVAEALKQLGAMLDFEVTFVSDSDLAALRSQINLRSYVVIATMGDGDEEALEAVLGSDASYIGFVASREKSANVFRYLQEKGIPRDHIDRVKSPAGLELGAETLPEIAFSVMAEVVQLSKKQRPHEPATEKPAVQTKVVDPICGMTVEAATAKHSTVFEGRSYYFCCKRCKETFEKAPAQYTES